MKLKRKEVASKYYGKHNEINTENRDYVIYYLNEMYNFLNNYEYESNPDFIFCGRKKFIYDEIEEIMNGKKYVDNPVYFVLGSLEEFLSNNNEVHISDSDELGISWNDLRDANDRYISTGIICLEEMEIIKNIIKKNINQLSGHLVDEETLNSIPESLRDFVYIHNGNVYANQKIPKELEEEFETYCILVNKTNNED